MCFAERVESCLVHLMVFQITLHRQVATNTHMRGSLQLCVWVYIYTLLARMMMGIEPPFSSITFWFKSVSHYMQYIDTIEQSMEAFYGWRVIAVFAAQSTLNTNRICGQNETHTFRTDSKVANLGSSHIQGERERGWITPDKWYHSGLIIPLQVKHYDGSNPAIVSWKQEDIVWVPRK